jgi:hypothetical protein
MRARLAVQNQGNERGDDAYCDKPPAPMNAPGHDFRLTEFAGYELLVIKVLGGEIEGIGASLFGPAGGIVGAAFGTGAGVGRHGSAAVGADLGWHTRGPVVGRGLRRLTVDLAHAGVFLVDLEVKTH